MHHLNPFLMRKPFNLLFQSLGDCFKPYKLLHSMHTRSLLLLNPSGSSTYTSLSIPSFRNAVMMSIMCISKSRAAAIANNMCRDVSLKTGEYVSS